MTILLQTPRLILKAPEKSDIENLYLLQSDPSVMQFIGKGIRTLAECQHGLELAISHYQHHGFSLGNVYEKGGSNFVGRAGLIYLAFDDKQPDVEVGYALEKNSWQKGYATELTNALISWAFKNIPVKKLVGIVQPNNIKSKRVLVKCGMQYLRTDKYNGISVHRYEIQKNDVAAL